MKNEFETAAFYRIKCYGCNKPSAPDECSEYYMTKEDCIEAVRGWEGEWTEYADALYCPNCVTWCKSCESAEIPKGGKCPECGTMPLGVIEEYPLEILGPGEPWPGADISVSKTCITDESSRRGKEVVSQMRMNIGQKDAPQDDEWPEVEALGQTTRSPRQGEEGGEEWERLKN